MTDLFLFGSMLQVFKVRISFFLFFIFNVVYLNILRSEKNNFSIFLYLLVLPTKLSYEAFIWVLQFLR